MWFFDFISTGFSEVAGWFGEAEYNLGLIPVIGTVAAAPFGWVKNGLLDIAAWFTDTSTWADDMIEVSSILLANIEAILVDIFDIETWKTGITDAITFAETLATDFSGAVLGVLGTTWDSAVDLATDFSGAVLGVLGSTWDWTVDLATDFSGAVFGVLGTTWTEICNIVADFVGLVGDAVEEITMSFTYAGTLLSATIPAFIVETYQNSRDLVDNWVGYVYGGVMSWSIEQYEYLIATLFNTLDKSWTLFEDHMKWLIGKIIDMVADAAEVFAEKIWNMVEKVVEKL